jgi:hypothetical protein
VINLKKALPIIVAVVAVAAGWFFLKGNKTGGLPGVGKTYTMKSLKAIIDLGVPVKCSYKVGEIEYEGYVKGQQWRGKMQQADGRQGEVIIKDNCMWSWTDDKKGITMCFEPEEGEDSVWDNPEYMTTDIEYTCRPAAITDAQFNPPADVNFMNLDDLMNPEGFPMPETSTETAPETLPGGMDIPTTPEDFDMSRYQDL